MERKSVGTGRLILSEMRSFFNSDTSVGGSHQLCKRLCKRRICQCFHTSGQLCRMDREGDERINGDHDQATSDYWSNEFWQTGRVPGASPRHVGTDGHSCCLKQCVALIKRLDHHLGSLLGRVDLRINTLPFSSADLTRITIPEVSESALYRT